jgi:hypothetical protein
MLEEIRQIAATERFVFVRTSEIFRGGLKYSVLHVHVPTSRIARGSNRGCADPRRCGMVVAR